MTLRHWVSGFRNDEFFQDQLNLEDEASRFFGNVAIPLPPSGIVIDIRQFLHSASRTATVSWLDDFVSQLNKFRTPFRAEFFKSDRSRMDI
jgi:hypothetical protein